MKKFFNVVMCLMLAVSLLTACGGGTSASTTAAQTSATTAAAAAATTAAATTAAAETTAQAAAEETGGIDHSTEYRIQILAGATDFTSSELTSVGQYMKEKFNMVFEYISYTGDIREKMNLMLAAGDYGEIQEMQRDDIVSAYIGAGALLDLEQYKDKMPDFWNRFEEVQIPYWRIVGNGKLYKWEMGMAPLGDMDIETQDITIRTDVLEKYGWPNPVSETEWINLLKKAVEDFPEADGQPTIGMVAPFAEPWGLQGIAPIMYEKSDSYLPLSNEGYTYNVKTGKFEDYFKNKYVKESLFFFNKLYREGLLDEECFTDTLDRVLEKLHSGVGISVWYAGWMNNSLIAQTAPERQYITLPVQSDTMVAEGQKRLIRKETTRSFNSYGITKNAKHPERIAEIVNWAHSDEGAIILRSGIEGVDWERDASGKRVLSESRRAALIEKDPKWNLTKGIGTYSFLGSFNQRLSDNQFPDLLSHGEIYDEFSLSDRQKEAFKGMGWANSKDWWIKNGEYGWTGLAGAVYIDSTTDLGKVHQKMTEVRVKWSANMILAKDADDFEKIYKQAMDEYDLLDHDSVINEYNRLLEEAESDLGK